MLEGFKAASKESILFQKYEDFFLLLLLKSRLNVAEQLR